MILDRCLIGAPPGIQFDSVPRGELPEVLCGILDTCLAEYDGVGSRKFIPDGGKELLRGMLLTPTDLLFRELVPDRRDVGFLTSSVKEVFVEVPYVRKLPYLKDCVEGVVDEGAAVEEIDLYLVECVESLLLLVVGAE